jgi:hypothetical protein
MKKITFIICSMLSFGFAFAQPTTNAPVPTKPAADVISVFSDAYSNIATNYNPNWGQSGTVNTTFNPAGGTDLVMAYTNFNYQGTEITTQNASTMEFLHVDIWCNANPTTSIVKVTPVNNGTGAGEFLVTLNHTQGSWFSVDIPKSAFTGMNWDSVFQLKFAANGPGSSVPVNIYLDNIYFWKAPSTPSQLDLLLGFQPGESGGVYGAPFGAAPVPVLEAGTGSNTTQVLKIVGNPAGETWQGIDLNLTSLVNLTTTKTMTMDVFSDTPVTFLVKVTGGVGGPSVVAASATHTGGSTWQTVSFTFNTALDGQAALANGTYSGFVIHTYWAPGAISFATVAKPARTFYVDNIRGPLGTPPVVPSPTTAAPTPPNRAPADVKSIFSNAYAPISTIGYTGDDNTFDNTWCPATTSLVQIAGNDTNRIVGLGCEGITFLAGRFDATTFTHLHLDFWTATATLDKSFNIKFSNWNGGSGEANAIEFSVTNANFLTNPNPGNWISLDIPLQNFTAINGANRNDLVQFIITSDLGVVFYDNLYLHKNTVLSNDTFELASFSAYPNPTSSEWNISAKQNITSIELFDVTGKTVLTLNPNNTEVVINASELSNGIYFAKVSSDVTSKTIKLVKN